MIPGYPRIVQTIFIVSGNYCLEGQVGYANQFRRIVLSEWFDKPLQFIINDNGTAGFIGEHSMMDGSKLEDRAKRRAADLNESAKKLRDVFHDKKDKNNPAVREQADKVLAAAADVNRVMAANRFTEKVQRNWEVLRSDLNALAQIYSLSPL